LLVAVVVVDVSARAMSLAAVVVLLLRQHSFACCDAFEVKTHRLYKNENTSVVTSEMNEQ
jgi:hypothetical protein